MTRKLKVFRCEVRSANGVTWSNDWVDGQGQPRRSTSGVVFLLARSIAEATAFAGPTLTSVKEIGVGYVTDDLTQRMMGEKEVREDAE